MKKIFERTFQVLAIAGLITFNFITPTFAADATVKSDILTDSRPTVAANHTLTFTLQNTWDASETLSITFAGGFDTTGFANTDPLDYDIEDDTVAVQVRATGGCAADEIDITSISGDVFTFTLCAASTSIASGSVIEIEIGTNATTGGTGNDQIENPSKVAAAGTADIYTTTLGGTSGTTGDILVAIQDGVTLSATVDETLTFTVAGRSAANCNTQITGGTEPASPATETTLPFGTVSSDTFYNLCQALIVGTNASGGYSTTLESVTLPTSGGDTILQGDCDGACSITASAPWDTASTNNGYAYCMKDNGATNGAETADGAEWTAVQQCAGGSQAFKLIANRAGPQAPQAIMASAGATTTNDDSYIGYRLNIGAGQAAGTYQAIIVYTTTPTF